MTEILQQLGLSLNEAKIYEALLDLKEAGVGEISSEAQVHRRNVYDTIKRLIDKGLIFPILSKGENIYAPVDPDKLLELVREKENILNKALPELRKKYAQRPGKQEAYIYRGAEGFKNYMRDILRVGKDVYFIGGKLIWQSREIKGFSEQFFREIKRKKIKFHCVFDAIVKEKGEKGVNLFPPPHRFLPPAYSTNSAITIFGDYIVTYTGMEFKKLDENVTIFVLKDENLAESYKIWFKFIFSHCVG